MAEATANGAVHAEEEVLPPEPTTKSMILGEILGSFLLSFLGLGIGLSATLWSGPDAPWFSDIWPTAAGWTLAIALGIYVTNTLSGAHFNPAVTIAMASSGRHPWRLVPLYIGCQILGWFIGAAALMAMFGRNFFDLARERGITIGSPDSLGLASALTTYSPSPGNPGTGGDAAYTTVPFLTGLSGEIMGTAVLLLVILSLLETRHVNAPSAWFFPLIVGATVGLLIMFVAPVSQASFNPARDIGPRIMLLFLGFGSVAFPGPNGGLSLVVTAIGPIIGAVAGVFFFDKVVRPNIPGVEPEREITTLSQLAYDPTLEIEHRRAGTLSGHAAALPAALLAEDHDVDLVMLDVGGCVYDDDPWALAVLRAARELSGSEVDEAEFWQVYDEQRQAQGGSLSRTVAARFAPGADPDELSELAKKYADYTVSSLYPDAKPTLAALATRYKLGAVVNPRRAHTEALERDGLMRYFAVVTHPEKVDSKTPDARMWRRALEEVGVSSDRAVHVGNRIDNDVRPAKQAGLHTIWLLRGEAPPSPTIEQLTEPDAVVTTFSGVPNALVSIAPQRVPAGTS
jgi:MIP family channel proteins